MNKQEFIIELEKIIEVDAGVISESDNLEKYAGWDSLAVLSFMAMVDAKFQCQVATSEINKCKTVTDLIALMGSNVA
jgi:acyl carrier protein